MKTRFLLAFLLVVCMMVMSCVCFAEEGADDLHFDKYYVTMPEMNVRSDPNTPGSVGTVVAGQEVNVIDTDGIWCSFTFMQDGESKTGCTWIGAISPAVRIHLIEDEFIFRKPINDREDFGLISTWREPTDPDLLILWEETAEDGSKWYYVVSVEDCRGGYMRHEAKFEVVE